MSRQLLDRVVNPARCAAVVMKQLCRHLVFRECNSTPVDRKEVDRKDNWLQLLELRKMEVGLRLATITLLICSSDHAGFLLNVSAVSIVVSVG